MSNKKKITQRWFLLKRQLFPWPIKNDLPTATAEEKIILGWQIFFNRLSLWCEESKNGPDRVVLTVNKLFTLSLLVKQQAEQLDVHFWRKTRWAAPLWLLGHYWVHSIKKIEKLKKESHHHLVGFLPLNYWSQGICSKAVLLPRANQYLKQILING